jgi:adenosylcobinamide-GDP ribazoletransferase
MQALDAAAARPLAAVSFLTRLPLGARIDPRSEALPRAAPLFPLVGAALGAVVGGVAIGLSNVLPPLLAALLAVAVELALTGALHVDGLADSADGLGGSGRERSLAIMRDHSLGAYGGSALALDLAIKATALATLAESGALTAIVAAFAISRAAPLPLALLPYARAGAGTGRALAGRIGISSVGVGVALAIAVAAAAARLDAPSMVLGAIAVTGAVAAAAHRRLGGVTGDVMGAAVELTVACCLIVAVALDG